jgi:protein SCO1
MRRSFGFAAFAAVTMVALSAVTTADVAGSLYEIQAPLVDQDGKTLSLDRYRGHPVIVTLFYGGCPNACPLLIESLRATEQALSPSERTDLRVLLVTIDPERDTPAALSKLATQRRVDLSRWTLATMTANDVRMLAATLNVQYRRLPDGEYNHSSVLTLLSKDGALLKQTSLLGKSDADFVAAVSAASRASRAIGK